MAWNGVERRRHWKAREVERRGSQRSQLGGRRPPDTADLLLAEDAHPARLRASDLDDPKGFRERLVAWLMKQH